MIQESWAEKRMARCFDAATKSASGLLHGMRILRQVSTVIHEIQNGANHVFWVLAKALAGAPRALALGRMKRLHSAWKPPAPIR